jgi:hypothetical protein
MNLHTYILPLLCPLQQGLLFTGLLCLRVLHHRTITYPKLTEIDGCVCGQLNHVRSNFDAIQQISKAVKFWTHRNFGMCGSSIITRVSISASLLSSISSDERRNGQHSFLHYLRGVLGLLQHCYANQLHALRQAISHTIGKPTA